MIESSTLSFLSSFLRHWTFVIFEAPHDTRRKPLRPKHENHFPNLIAGGEKIAGRFERNARGFLNRITVRATTDRGKRDRFDSVLQRNP